MNGRNVVTVARAASAESVTSATFGAKERRHRWGEDVRIAGCDTHDGNDRTERTCSLCGLVKITVHPPHGLPWREWRTKDGMTAVLTMTPPCRGKVLEAAE